MAGNSELDRFVRDALLAGQSREAIRSALRRAGWSEEQLAGVLDDWAEVDFPVPVPRPRASLSARDAFLYLVLFSLLYFLCYHLGSLLFDLINAALPDASERGYAFFASTRFSTASLIIAFPLFAWLAARLTRETERAPIKRFSPVRRWLTYLTLFVSAAAIIGDLTALVYNLLGGELTLRFVLKVLVVGMIAGSVFGFYLLDLRREEGSAPAVNALGRRLLIAAGIAAVGALIGGFLLMGSPATQREQRMDMRRIGDLRELEGAIRSHYRTHAALPESLEALAERPGLGLSLADPQTGEPYGYVREDGGHFRLCATFATDSGERRGGRRVVPVGVDWAHGIGPTCFDRRIDPADRGKSPEPQEPLPD